MNRLFINTSLLIGNWCKKMKILEQIPSVQRIEQNEHLSILFLDQAVHIPTWLGSLPKELNIQELSVDRISLHEIFIDIASDSNLLQEEGEKSA